MDRIATSSISAKMMDLVSFCDWANKQLVNQSMNKKISTIKSNQTITSADLSAFPLPAAGRPDDLAVG
jgi:hypothetical protein